MSPLVRPTAEAVAPDLRHEPFTIPGSRLMVLAGEAGWLSVVSAEYERPVDRCVVAEVRVTSPAGPQPVTGTSVDRIALGPASLTFAGPSALSVGGLPDGWAVQTRPLVPPTGTFQPGLPSVPLAGMSAGAGGDVVLWVGGPPAASVPHADHLAATAALWHDWFARCPRVRADLAPMAAVCWWVLGANLLPLHGHDDALAVVPSRLGYVGLWQWDAYFIAVGLRHGAPDLARRQLDLALRHATPQGQLPDVVHDVVDGRGVLTSSEDLPPADLAALRRTGSAAADLTRAVPLTKPPLTAWAVATVDETDPDPAWRAGAMAAAARSQEWWFACCDTDGDGLPEYPHPYCSGLDDSPVFDHPGPVASPDLAAYLVLQDDLLAEQAQAAGRADDAARHRTRAAATMRHLGAMWDGTRFRARTPAGPLDSYPVTCLLPLLTGRLDPAVADRLAAALDDPQEFAAPWGVPSVARRDPDFDPQVMWRGPAWVSIAALLVAGLDRSGHRERADRLAEQTLAAVVHAGGPHEYLDPLTGHKAPGATTSFSWSAALFVDLAVRVSR